MLPVRNKYMERSELGKLENKFVFSSGSSIKNGVFIIFPSSDIWWYCFVWTQGLFGSFKSPRSSLERGDFGLNNIKKACAKLIIIKDKIKRKEIILLATPSIMAK